MKNIIKIAKSFKRQAKPLLKKYASLYQDLAMLEKELIENPRLGKSIGHDSYKIRLAVKSKGRGKSGGLRVISNIDPEIIGVVEQNKGCTVVTLLSIYDKSDVSSITDKELRDLIDALSYDI